MVRMLLAYNSAIQSVRPPFIHSSIQPSIHSSIHSFVHIWTFNNPWKRHLNINEWNKLQQSFDVPTNKNIHPYIYKSTYVHTRPNSHTNMHMHNNALTCHSFHICMCLNKTITNINTYIYKIYICICMYVNVYLYGCGNALTMSEKDLLQLCK